MSVFRTRNFATVLYPESAVDNWQQILDDFHIPTFISPLHCNDVNPDGEPKKMHFHIMIMFDNVKTEKQAREIFCKIGGVGCEIIDSPRGYARYLCHLDNPEKFRYSIDEVISLSGADYIGTINLPKDNLTYIREMVSYVIENNILYYCDLLEYCIQYRPDWYRALCEGATYVVKEYLRDSRYKRKGI